MKKETKVQILGLVLAPKAEYCENSVNILHALGY